MVIESRQNSKIKQLVKLQKRSEREANNRFIIEGTRELTKALQSGYQIDTIFFCNEIIRKAEIEFMLENRQIELLEVSKEIFNHIAYREGSGGIIATATPKPHDFEQLILRPNPLILILEGIEKPGNIGAIYRTADAAGIDGIILCDPLADIYNPNAIRSSLGTVFSVATVVTDSESAINFVKSNNFQIYTTYLEASVGYHTIDYRKSSAIVMGTESTGISKSWIEASTHNIIIPMQGIADSLNVSVSAAIVLYEACRQRDFK